MSFSRSFFLPAAMVGLLAVTVAEYADAGGGTFTVGRTSIQETNGLWRLFFSITLPKPPPTARPAIRFAFTPQTVFECGAPGSAPVATPVKHPKVVMHAVDVAFGDPSGTIWKQAKGDTSLARDEGLVPGEYKLVAKGPYGDIGDPVTVTLNSECK